MTNIIFAIMMYPMLLILYFVQKFQGKPQLHTLFGIRYSREWLSEDEEQQLIADYRRSMNRFLLLWGFLPIVTFFIPYISIIITVWMLWMIAVIVMSMAPYFHSNRKLLALKKERCHEETTANLTYTELKQAGMIRRVKWQQFAVPMLISILLAIGSLIYFYQKDFLVHGIMLTTFAACTILFYLAAVCMDRMRTKVISSNSDINTNFARASKNIYKSFWIWSAWLNTAYTAVVFAILLITQSLNGIGVQIILWGAIVYSLIELLLGMRMLSKQQLLRKQYAKYMDLPSNNKEENWIGGMFYYNPKDTKSMVEHPAGNGTTINMATTAGKVTIGFTGILFLGLLIICLWVILEEFTPISLTLKDDSLIASHLKNDYVIATDTITELTLEDELPKVSRISGTAMEHLKKGNWRNADDGRIQILLNPQNKYYLRVVSDDIVYYLGGYNDEETLAAYELLTNE